MPPVQRVNVHLRLNPRVHAAIKRQADEQGLPAATYIVHSLMIRLGYELGVESGLHAAAASPPLEFDNAVKEAVKELLHDYGETE